LGMASCPRDIRRRRRREACRVWVNRGALSGGRAKRRDKHIQPPARTKLATPRAPQPSRHPPTLLNAQHRPSCTHISADRHTHPPPFFSSTRTM
jgi:hypothetical protein